MLHRGAWKAWAVASKSSRRRCGRRACRPPSPAWRFARVGPLREPRQTRERRENVTRDSGSPCPQVINKARKPPFQGSRGRTHLARPRCLRWLGEGFDLVESRHLNSVDRCLRPGKEDRYDGPTSALGGRWHAQAMRKKTCGKMHSPRFLTHGWRRVSASRRGPTPTRSSPRPTHAPRCSTVSASEKCPDGRSSPSTTTAR